MKKKPDRATYLKGYLLRCQKALRLEHWTITVADEPADAGDVAAVNFSEGQHHAKFYFSNDFWAESPGEKRNTIGHELAHCLTRETLFAARDQLKELVGKGALYRSAFRPIKDNEELLVDSLASIFEAVLPPWEGP